MIFMEKLTKRQCRFVRGWRDIYVADVARTAGGHGRQGRRTLQSAKPESNSVPPPLDDLTAASDDRASFPVGRRGLVGAGRLQLNSCIAAPTGIHPVNDGG